MAECVDVPYECSLDAKYRERAKDELCEIDRDGAVKRVREWLLLQREWLVCPTDAKFILSFLRNRKFEHVETCERLARYWKARCEHRRWFGDIDVCCPVIREHLYKGVFQPLPKRDSEGCIIILVRLGLVDDQTVEEFDDQIKTAVAVTDHLLRDEVTQVAGIKFIYDLEDLSLRQVFKFGEDRIKKLTSVWLRTYPVRFRAIHYLNLGPVFDIIIRLVKQVLPAKLKQRIHTHYHLGSLYKKMDKALLPLEYLPDDYMGDSAGAMDDIVTNFCQEISLPDNRDYIRDLSSDRYICDMKLKPKDV